MASTNEGIINSTAQGGTIHQPTVAARRSADYKPNMWSYDHLQSLGRDFDEEEYRKQADELKDEVEGLFVETINPVEKLELMDNIAKLGLAAYFKKEIDEVVENLELLDVVISCNLSEEDSLYATCLYYRMLRLHGRYVSQGANSVLAYMITDMFVGFMEKANKGINLNVKAMVSLFECSQLAMEGESLLEEAGVFATSFLKKVCSPSEGTKIAKEALKLPLHLQVEWFNVRNHILIYEKEDNSNFSLLKLAKLHFNMLQAAHQRDLKDILRWWMRLGTMENLSFARNRVVESYLWATGVAWETQYGNLRKWLTKVTKLVIIIDDIYDVFGTLEELETLTKAVERWDFNGTELLPDSITFCMKMLYDTVDEIAHEFLQGKGWKVQQHIQKAWTDFCKGLLAEARWYHNSYCPNLREYLDNGWVTSCGALLSLHIVYSVSQGSLEEANDFLRSNHDLVYNTSMIIRLCNDQGTSKAEQERGDAPTSIVCYMIEADVSEAVACKHIRDLIADTWKKINNVCMSQSQSIKFITNMARVAHFIYMNGDGFGTQDRETRKQVLSLLVDTVPLR